VSRLGEPNLLFRNAGRGPDGRWRFEERGAAAGVTEPIASFPTWFWDYDNDGRLDLLVARFGTPLLYRNQGPDAEGRYRYGMTLYQLGYPEDAATQMRACIEAVRTSPAYKYRTDKHWMNEAQSFLRSQMAGSQ